MMSIIKHPLDPTAIISVWSGFRANCFVEWIFKCVLKIAFFGVWPKVFPGKE